MLHSVMGLCLDHITYIIPPTSTAASSLAPNHVHNRSASQIALDSHLHSIRGTTQNVSNRFFDKAFTLIVDPSTRSGAMGEHSPVDALVPSIVAEYGVVQGVDVTAFDLKRSEGDQIDGEGWDRLDWSGDEQMWKECKLAQDRATKIVEDSDDSVIWFEKYGADWIKNIGA